jgi:Holliday junction DNA helicase RuvA
MYVFIKGTLIDTKAQYAIIETHGMGYQVFVPADVMGKLPQIGQNVMLHLSFVIREMSQALYGFLTAQERDLFEALMNVSGIGPKIALAIVGHIPSGELLHAIKNNQIQPLTKVPGIGKKTAERLIIELRDKIENLVHHSASDYAVNMSSDPRSQMISDAMSALINLGCTQLAAQKVIKKTLQDAPEDISLELLITNSLKHLQK